MVEEQGYRVQGQNCG